MTCNGNCARCCCCGSKQLRELPGYNEDINNPGRPDKATIRWNFDDGIFNGLFFDLIRVNYTDPSNSGSYASTERVCMVEYRLPPSGYYGGPNQCPGEEYRRTSPWVRVAVGKCCEPFNTPNRGWVNTQAVFYRVALKPCDIAINIARCKKTTYACDYVNSIDSTDPCGYLVTARMKIDFRLEAARFSSRVFTENLATDCAAVTYPNVSDVPTTFPSDGWTGPSTQYCVETLVPVTRSRVVSSLRTIPTEIEITLPSGLPELGQNQKECCSEWGVPENAFGIPKPGGWNDEYFGCLNDDFLKIDATPECLGPRCTEGFGYNPGSPCDICFNCQVFDNSQILECVLAKYSFEDGLGDWRFVGTGEPA